MWVQMLPKVLYTFLRATTEKWAFTSWKCKAGMKDADVRMPIRGIAVVKSDGWTIYG